MRWNIFRWWSIDPNGYARHVVVGFILALLVHLLTGRRWMITFTVVLIVAIGKELYDWKIKKLMEFADIIFTLLGIVPLLLILKMSRWRVAITAVLAGLLSISTALAQGAPEKPNTLHVGITMNLLWMDAQEGPFKNAAGPSVGLVASHQADRFIAHGEVAWINYTGDPDNFQAVQAHAVLGIIRDAFALGGEVGYQQYFNGRNEGDTMLGVNGRFTKSVGRIQLGAGARGGFLPFAEKTTIYGGVFLNLLYDL